MSWNAASFGSSGGEAVGQARTKWLFAEGAQGFFRTFLMVLNPNGAATTATVTFLPEAGGNPVVRSFPMTPMSRLVVDGGSVPEIANRSFGIVVEATQPIVAERAMYFGAAPSILLAGGHVSAGAPDAATSWFFAEGATGSFFDTFLLVATRAARRRRHADLSARQRADPIVGQDRAGERAADGRTSRRRAGAGLGGVRDPVTSDVPIVAERAMYWIGDPARGPNRTTASVSSRPARSGCSRRAAWAGRWRIRPTSCSAIRRRRRRT